MTGTGDRSQDGRREGTPAGRRFARMAVPGFAPFSMQVHPPGELVSDHMVAHGVWEPFESSLLRRLLAPGGCMLDAGANLGYYSVLAARIVGDTGRVVAVEPDADNFALLCANTAGLCAVETARLALGATPGRAGVSVNAGNRGDLFVTPGTGTQVSVEPGDALDLPRLDLVKIDVQGAEAAVLRGLRQTLARSGDGLSVMIEAWPYGLERFGDSAAALLDELLALELPVWWLDQQSSRPVRLTKSELSTLLLKTLTVSQQGFVNLLLSSSSRVVGA